MPPDPDSPPRPAAATLESCAALLLCVAAVAGPVALGGTLAWACFGLEAAMAGAAILWAWARPRPLAALVIPVGVSLLVLGQVVPLPDRLLTAIAPVSADAWRGVHEGMPDAWGRISITPAASAAAARRLLVGVATILVVADLARDPRRRRWFFTALAVTGGIVWLLAIMFPIDHDTRAVYGLFSLRGPIEFRRTPERQPMQTAGAGYLDWVTVGEQRYRADSAITGDGIGGYIYSNHFANALCLTIPALCAIVLARTRTHLPRPAAAVGVGMGVGVGTMMVMVMIMVMATAVWASAIWAESRAGTASLLFACSVYLSLVLENRRLRRLFGVIAAAGLLVLLGFIAVFQGPLDVLTSFAPAAWQPFIGRSMLDVRMVAARIAGRMFLASPLLGTGLGSYGDLYPRFSGLEHVMFFAHNDHAQLWAEAGLMGLVVSGSAAGVLIHRFVRFCRERRPCDRTLDAAAWAALAAGAAHSVFDWNMHVPANAFLACLVVGLALSSVVPQVAAPGGGRRARVSSVATAGFVVALLWAVALLARDAWLERPVEELRRAITAARLARSPADHEHAATRLTAAIATAETARGYAGRDWRLPVLIGQAQLHLGAAAAAGVAVEASAGRTAEEWFREAMRASPAARGLPEPAPRTPMQ